MQNTPRRRLSKTLSTIDTWGSKLDRNMFSIAICRQIGDKWQSKTVSNQFYLRSSPVLEFSIAYYPVCDYANRENIVNSQLIRFSFLHRRIRRACAHAVSKETPTTIDIKQIPSQHPISDHHRPNCICLLGTSMAAYAISLTRWLRNLIRRSPLRIGLNTKTS